MKKINAALERGKPVDGHAPGLRGDDARRYIERGISTDHECFTKEEALDKLSYGMKIIIREGSAAKNFEALIDLLHDYPDKIMFCSDDKHPDSLVEGHINQLCARAIARGIDLFKVLEAACINPVLHYKLDVGLLREGDAADFILAKDLVNFIPLETWIDGTKVAENGHSLIETDPHLKESATVNQFNCKRKETVHFRVPVGKEAIYHLPVIEAYDGQLITGKWLGQPLKEDGCWVSDPVEDILKIVVVNRYSDMPVAKAFIRNIGLKQGALASSVAHDSHNIVAVGVDDESLCKAVNLVIDHRGGVSCVKDDLEMILPLPVAGLMSHEDGYQVAELYTLIDRAAKDAGSTLSAPLKLSDRGLFDGDIFQLL
jgi:adenine deaminase